jgi:hypothetical protein
MRGLQFDLTVGEARHSVERHRLNKKRILYGGLYSGLIMNIGEAILHVKLLARETDLLYQNHDLPFPSPGMHLLILVIATFLLGIASVWIYAAIRPRFGPGPRSALIAGVVVWGLAHLWSGVYLGAAYPGIIPATLAWLPVAWGFMEALVATLVGAAIYKEE